jgi:hypothetical protein
MRSNLAEAINLGWPTETNMNIINNKSYQGATVSQWLNIPDIPVTLLISKLLISTDVKDLQ